MSKKTLLTAVGSALVAASTLAQAAPFGFYDPRSLGMGGVGVSAGTSANASFFNPALLAAAHQEEDFALEFPIVAARAADPNELIDDIDRLDSSGQSLSNAINQFNTAQTQANSQAVATALGDFRGVLTTISSKSLEGGLFAGAVIGIPSKKIGAAVHIAGRADFAGNFTYANSDDALLQAFQTAAQTYATTGNPADLATLLATFGTGAVLEDPDLQSSVSLRGLVQTETGVALARNFESLGNIALGVTPKAVKVSTVDYRISAQQADIDLDLGKKDYSNVNLDIGAAKDFGNGFKAGAVVKNLSAQTYETALGNKIEVKPQGRAGLSHHTSWTTVAVDVDVTKNDPIGFDKATQFAAVGAELNIFKTVQLRLGYKNDLKGNYDPVTSAGLGFSPFGVHIDLGIAGNGDEVAAALQLGFRF